MSAVAPTSGPDPADRSCDAFELAALVYLVLPLAIFLLGWMRWPVAVLLLGLLAFNAASVLRGGLRRAAGTGLSPLVWLMLALAAAAWVSASGLAGDFHLNTDWRVRMSVLRDLSVGAWPVAYGANAAGQDLLLRFSMGYYLVPALVGRGFGLDSAHAALWLWTSLGCTLFLGLVCSAAKATGWKPALLVIALVIAFSGLDAPGWLLTEGRWPRWGEHIEWWATLFQYSSDTTLLFWVPNHALPAWLGATLVWRHRNAGLEPAPAAALMLGAVMWSPLVAFGLAPLVLAVTLRGQALGPWLRGVLRPPVLATLPILALLVRFMTFGVPAEAAGPIEQLDLGLLSEMVVFALVEWGFLAAVVWRCGQGDWLLLAAGAQLLALPFLHLGPGNDIVMRGGIPALTIVMLAAFAALRAPAGPPVWRGVLGLLLLLGALTPLQEWERAFAPSPRYRQDDKNFVELNQTPWHYVGSLDRGWLRRLLREPVALPDGPRASPSPMPTPQAQLPGR